MHRHTGYEMCVLLSEDARDARPLVYPARLLGPGNLSNAKLQWEWKASAFFKLRRNTNEAVQVATKDLVKFCHRSMCFLKLDILVL